MDESVLDDAAEIVAAGPPAEVEIPPFLYAVFSEVGDFLWSGKVVADAEGATRAGIGPSERLVAVSAAHYDALRRGVAFRLDAGQLVQIHRVPDLAVERARAIERIDAAAERARLAFVTPGVGQAMEYRATLDDAMAYRPGLDAAKFPWLAAEVEAQATQGRVMSLAHAADLVIARTAAWEAAGPEIKRLRRAAKLAIEAAGTVADVRAVEAALAWPFPQ